MNYKTRTLKHNLHIVKLFLTFVFFCIGTLHSFSQTITYIQPMAFGEITPGTSGGTITIGNNGSLIGTTGTVIWLKGTRQPAIFNIRVTGNRTITAINFSTATLTRTGGGSITLTFGTTNPAPSFTLNNSNGRNTDVSVGGTLTIGNITSNPAGLYSGSFTVTAIQQ